MNTSPLPMDEIRAAAATYHELDPEYGDAVLASFLEKVDQQIAATADRAVAARLGHEARPERARLDRRRTLLAGVAIGAAVTGIPSLDIATRGGAVLGADESSFLVAVLILLAIVAAISLIPIPRRGHQRSDGRR